MTYSIEVIDYKVAVYRELRELHEREIARIDRLLRDLGRETVESEEGEVISYADCADLSSRH
ncbi:hypothetical protein QUA20_04385 [Microcoleus sp. Pol7_A1]|jgi:uncharacterized protein YjaG (DUF416 family)|uniref:hypothetical protein n=1 Tax=unclassified Microcoleus TaxID=2642155 RepID=UPI002FD56D84